MQPTAHIAATSLNELTRPVHYIKNWPTQSMETLVDQKYNHHQHNLKYLHSS